MIPFKKFIPGIAWFFLVLVLICIPGDDLPQGEDWMSVIYFDKWVHAGLFGMLSLLFMNPVLRSSAEPPYKKNLFIKIAIAASIWGLATEFIQDFFIEKRAYDLWDWGADSLGAFVAFLIMMKLLSRRGEA